MKSIPSKDPFYNHAEKPYLKDWKWMEDDDGIGGFAGKLIDNDNDNDKIAKQATVVVVDRRPGLTIEFIIY